MAGEGGGTPEVARVGLTDRAGGGAGVVAEVELELWQS